MPNPVVVDAAIKDAPSITPLASTLLDHATVSEGIEYLNERSLFQSYNCLDMAVPTALCPEPTEAKDFQDPYTSEGIRFAVYGGVACKAFDFDEATGLAEINRVFTAKESIGVERAFMDTLFIDGPDDDPGAGVALRWEQAEDLTPAGGAVLPEVGLAILEGHASSIYAGVPTLHIPRTIGSLLLTRNAGEMQAGKAYTQSGSKMALGAGYEYPNHGPDGSDPAAGDLWMYASGEIAVARSEVLAKSVLDRSSNETIAIAERIYMGAIDCGYVSAVQVRVE